MIVGIVVLWGAYALGMWGYCLVRGYNVTPKDILNYKFPASVSAAQQPSTTSAAQKIAATSPGSSAQQAAAQGQTPSVTHPGVRPGPAGGPQPIGF